MSEIPEQLDRTEMVSEIVAAYVRHNSVPAAELPSLIRSVHDTLSSLGAPAAPEVPAEPLKPAVPVKKSVTDDYIIVIAHVVRTRRGLVPGEARP